MILFFLTLLALIFGSFVFQLFLPPILLLHETAILFVPAVYFYVCLCLPFPLTFAMSFFAGMFNDLLMIPQPRSHSDFPTGISILIYLAPGLVMHGLRPLFLRHRWETHCLLAETGAILSPFILLAQYAMLSFERRE